MHAEDVAAGHGFKSPEWRYNMSVRPSVWSSAGLFVIVLFVLISSLGVRRVAMHLFRLGLIFIEDLIPINEIIRCYYNVLSNTTLIYYG